MTIEDDGQPAGQPMTEDAAANLIAGTFGDDAEGLDGASDEAQDDNPNAEAADADEGQGDPGYEAQADEGEGEESDQSSADDDPEEPEYYDIEKLSPDMPFRLRDGTEYRWGDIKRGLAELQELPRQRQEFEGQVSQFRQQQAQTAQQAQILEQYLPLAVEVLRNSAPQVLPLPDPNLASQDVLEYNQQLAAHLASKSAAEEHGAKLRQLVDAYRQQQSSASQRTQAEIQEYAQQEFHKLRDAMPDLRDPQRAKEFGNEFLSIGQHYGFTPEELQQTRDHRLFLMARDLLAFRKAQAQKPKAVQKAKGAPPVKSPGKRKSDAEQKATAYREGMQKLRQTGSQDVAADLILNHLL